VSAPVRVILAALVIATSFAAAVWLHSGYEADTTRTTTSTRGYGGTGTTSVPITFHRKADWQDPLAIFLAITGLGVGVAILLPALRTTRAQ
jgi:hypothetical protein